MNITTGTIKRWIELKSVPQYYYFDLCRMDNIEVDYKGFSEKQKDQFFTPKELELFIERCFLKRVKYIIANWKMNGLNGAVKVVNSIDRHIKKTRHKSILTNIQYFF